jgi:hypothetical protein
MAVPETLCHPFATAKIVVWPATCSVRGGLIIPAGSRDATLCACGRRGERTGNRCDRDKGSKCFPHSRPSCACMACGHATAAPSTMPRNSRRCMSTPSGHCIRSTECIDRGWLRVACCKVLISVLRICTSFQLMSASPNSTSTHHFVRLKTTSNFCFTTTWS